MKKLKKILTTVLTACMLFSLSVINVFGAEDYTYTVTFYAGNQGTFSSMDGISVAGDGSAVISNQGDKIVISNLKINDVLTFDVQQGAVDLGDSSKYYVKGVRLSGRDNESTEPSVFHVNCDNDYVVAYGIRGNMVGYTVNYLDTEGNELAPSNTYYGNVGDKPVVAYLYMENYTPQALGLTKTLSSNEAENVFNFIYTPVSTEVITTPGETTTITTVVPGTTTTETTIVPAAAAGTTTTTTPDAGTADTGTPDAGTVDAGTPDAGTPDAGTADAGTGEAVINPDEVPQANPDVVDLDEDETPLAEDAEIGSEDVKKGLPLAAGIAIGVGAVAALAALGVFLVKRRKL